MKYSKILGAITVALAVLPATALAQMGYVSKQVNLRAGPATEYPIVATLLPGVEIVVEGCLSDYRWCDVVAGPNRGWAYAANIVYPYQGANVPVLTYGALIGLGIVAFSVGDYWDHHYHGRSWYPQRQQWVDRSWPRFGPGGHRLPGSEFGPDDHRSPPGPGFGPGGHRPPPPGPGFRPGDHRPPAGPVIRQGGQRSQQGPAVRQGGQHSQQGPAVRQGGQNSSQRGQRLEDKGGGR
jgi:uncharacterized protein YraI